MAVWKEQQFKAPGTWTWPGIAANVEVIVVGGGGGGILNPGPGQFCGGGGGGVARRFLPVTGPVPVTVGAGAPFNPAGPNNAFGGTSSFGPFQVGGGQSAHSQPSALPAYPPTAGSGGGSTQGVYNVGGPFGYGGLGSTGGGAGSEAIGSVRSGRGLYGYGGGGAGLSPGVTIEGGGGSTETATANSGGGGANGAGGSGIVIVRWFE